MEDGKTKVPIFERVLAFWFLYSATMLISMAIIIAVHVLLFRISAIIGVLMWGVIAVWAILLVIVIIMFIHTIGSFDYVRHLCRVIRGVEELE
jgi:hypothetical protein